MFVQRDGFYQSIKSKRTRAFGSDVSPAVCDQQLFLRQLHARSSDGATVIARYKATNNNTVGDINSEGIFLTIPQPFTNHNGGMIEFRNDNGTNNLYIGMGDGGSANDPNNNAQNINALLGKYLRITPSSGRTCTDSGVHQSGRQSVCRCKRRG